MPLALVRGLSDLMSQGAGLPPPPGTGGFRPPTPPPNPGGGFGKFFKFGKFLGIGLGALADLLLNPAPVADGTIPAWLKDPGESQKIQDETERPNGYYVYGGDVYVSQSYNGKLPPPVAPPPAKTVDNNSTPKPKAKTTKFPEPKQTKVDKCAGSCGGGGGGSSFDPNTQSAANLIQILNDQLVQNPLLKKIDATTTLTTQKLGDKIGNGGISGALGRLHKSLAFDRWLNLMNTALLFHNAFMLSNAVLDTIIQVFDNVLETIGFKFKDVEGDEIEFSQVVSNSAKSIITNIIGKKTFTLITNAAIKGNRIYQSAANVLYGVRGIIDSVQDIQETIGENVSFIGNALKKDGVVRENSYDWMPTNYDNSSRLLNKLEKVRDGADVLEDITSETVDIAEEIKELKDNKEELEKAIADAREAKLTEETDLKDYALNYPEPTEADEDKGTDDD